MLRVRHRCREPGDLFSGEESVVRLIQARQLNPPGGVASDEVIVDGLLEDR